MFCSTNEFFAMLAWHMCSGRPVVADCWCTKSSGDCVPSPIGNVAMLVEVGRLLHAVDQLVDRDRAEDLAGRVGACACRAG